MRRSRAVRPVGGRDAINNPINGRLEKLQLLQSSLGNQAVQRLWKAGALQTSLKVGAPDDKYEKQADAVAKQVVDGPAPTARKANAGAQRTPGAMGQTASDEISMKPIEISRMASSNSGKGAFTADSSVSSSINGLKTSGGRPLPQSERAYLEPRMGYDLGHVRIHTGESAEKAADSIQAKAFTIGNHVAFNKDQYKPGTTEGRRLIAHEATHTIQQTGKGGSNTGHKIEKASSNGTAVVQRFADEYHEEINVGALTRAGLGRESMQIHFGSWLRDMSQTIYPDTNPLVKNAIIHVLNHMARRKFGQEVTSERLGHYRPEEHVDNPDSRAPATDRPVRASIAYAKGQLRKAIERGNKTEGHIHFGNALHVVQDFFSHTNFVREAVRIYKNPRARARGLVTGHFGPKDNRASILKLIIGFANKQIDRSGLYLAPDERMNQRIREILRKLGIHLPEENRIPNHYRIDPREYPPNKIWFRIIALLTPVWQQAKEEAKKAVGVPTHTELELDSPQSGYLHFVAKDLAAHVTYLLGTHVRNAWAKKPFYSGRLYMTSREKKILAKMNRILDSYLRKPERGGFWEPIVKKRIR